VAAEPPNTVGTGDSPCLYGASMFDRSRGRIMWCNETRAVARAYHLWRLCRLSSCRLHFFEKIFVFKINSVFCAKGAEFICHACGSMVFRLVRYVFSHCGDMSVRYTEASIPSLPKKSTSYLRLYPLARCQFDVFYQVRDVDLSSTTQKHMHMITPTTYFYRHIPRIFGNTTDVGIQFITPFVGQ